MTTLQNAKLPSLKDKIEAQAIKVAEVKEKVVEKKPKKSKK